jgi:hypothetical protein
MLKLTPDKKKIAHNNITWYYIFREEGYIDSYWYGVTLKQGATPSRKGAKRYQAFLFLHGGRSSLDIRVEFFLTGGHKYTDPKHPLYIYHRTTKLTW